MLKYFMELGQASMWPQISLVLFLGSFCGLILWTYRRRAGEHYQDMAQLALDDPMQKEAGRE